MKEKLFSDFLKEDNKSSWLHIEPKEENIYLKLDLEYENLKNFKVISFRNCNFKEIDLNPIYKTHHNTSIHFDECIVNGQVDISFKHIKRLSINNCSFINQNANIYINGKIDEIQIINDQQKEYSSISFSKLTSSFVEIKNIISTGSLQFLNFEKEEPNERDSEEEFRSYINQRLIIKNCEFNNINFDDLTLNGYGIIQNLRCKTESFIQYNDFNNKLNINSCNFSSIIFIDTIFNNITSIQNTIVNTIKLDKVQFNDLTYFDDFEILDYKNCDRKTIRTIKQELQKTENRIDYDTFRSYELELYKKELKQTEKWWHFKDLFVLTLNSLFSKHGISWRRAIGMTVLFSLGFYTVLYIIKNLHNDFNITLNGINHFTSGYFKFFLITNFYDPLSENREYLKYFGEWLPFIFGKIVIGYGLYETVQSFRKYKK
ncbi:hypothetical protein Q4595_05575 [Wenyingzhuangia sp. 1_MG-2023]|nr:hypothetical protein [Wenyingzhuangia sp. 1_MG-2023]